MDKKTIVIILVALAVVLAGGYYYKTYYKPAGEAPAAAEEEQKAAQTAKPAVHEVRFTDSGPQPRVLEIKSGDKVKFTNTGTRPFWVASDPHPTHTICPGFDAVHGLTHNESWTYTFNFAAPKICSYHNHVDPTTILFTGVISIVK